MNILNEEVKRQKELMGLLTEEVSMELTDVDLKNISQNESDWLKDDWDELDDQIKNIYKSDEEFAGCMDGDDGLEEQRRKNCRDIFGRMNGGQKRNVLKRIGDFFRNLRWPKWMRKLNPFEKEMRSNMGGKKWRQHR